MSLRALRSSNDWSSAIEIGPTSSWSPSVWRIVTVVKVIEVIKHEVHIFLLFSLQVVYDSLILVDFDSYVSISLTRDGSRLDEVARLILIHVVATLGCRHIRHHYMLALCGSRTTVDFLLSPSHRLIVKLSTLFLQLIITDIEGVSAQTVVTHSQIISTTEIETRILLRYILIDEIELIVIIRAASSSVCGIGVVASAKELLLGTLCCCHILIKVIFTISVSVSSIIVDIMRRILPVWSSSLH